MMEKIPVYILLPVSMAFGIMASCLRNTFCKKYTARGIDINMFNATVSLFATILIILLSGGIGPLSAYTAVSALIFGLVTMLQMTTLCKALETGPFSYTSMINTLSTVIPAFSGAIFWGKKIRPFRYIGIVLMILCFVLSVKKGENEKKAQNSWYIYSAICFICTGTIGVLQKIHQSSSHKNELTGFLVLSFIISFVYFTVRFLFNCKKVGKSIFKITPLIIVIATLTGMGTGVINQLNLFLSGVMVSAVFFPVNNGGTLIFITLISILFYRERLTLRQWVGLGVGFIAVFCLCVKF